MSRNQARFLFWSPRILGIGFVVFASLFALDVFGEGLGLWQTAQALLIYLIPTAALAAVLAVAWRWEWVGAVSFATFAVLYAIKVLPQHSSWAASIALPLLAIAGLFLANWLERVELRSTR